MLREQAALALSGTESRHHHRIRTAERILPHRAGSARCAAERGGARSHRTHAVACHRRRHLGRAVHQGLLPGDRVRTLHRHDSQGSTSMWRWPTWSQLTAIYRRFTRSISRRSGGPMPGDARPIGVFNSGMGGLTVLRALVAQPPRRAIHLSRRHGATAVRHQKRRDGRRPTRCKRPGCCSTKA